MGNSNYKRRGRRKFIKKSTFIAGSLLMAHGVNAVPGCSVPRKKEVLGVALVGLGYYSTDLLAPALQQTKHCKLTGIVTGSPSKIPVWQQKYGIPDKNVYNYQNMDAVADNPDIDVLYIVLPTSMHSEYTIRAANAGKHAWCEKPMAMTAAECTAMIKACQDNKVKLSIGYRMQHEPNTQTLITWSKTKPYGNIAEVTARAGYYDGRHDHWKQQKAMGGGAMYDMGVYPLNAARYSTGEEPIAVTARHETNRPEIYHEVDETTYFSLEFPSGATANCVTSLGMGMNELRVECEKGWYELSPFQSYSGIRGKASDGTLLNKTVPNQQARQMDNDALAIINDQPVLVPGEEGRRDIRVVEAIYRSAAQQKRVEL